MSGRVHHPSSSQPRDLSRQARSLLNKLTVEKFEAVSQQILQLRLRSEDDVQGLAALICDKACQDEPFAMLYSELCERFTQVKVDDYPNFPQHLRQHCQQLFATRLNPIVDALEANVVVDRDDREAQRRYTNAVASIKRNAVKHSKALVKFINELALWGCISQEELQTCLSELFDAKPSSARVLRESDLEVAAIMLTNMGPHLDSSNQADFAPYFAMAAEAAVDPTVTKRVQFLFQDLLELQRAKWVDRPLVQARTLVPRSLKEIRLEALQEQIRTGNADVRRRGMEAMAALMAGDLEDTEDGDLGYTATPSMGSAPGLDRRYGSVTPPPPEPEERGHQPSQSRSSGHERAAGAARINKLRGMSSISRQTQGLSLRPQRTKGVALRPNPRGTGPPPAAKSSLPTATELFVPHKPEETPSLQNVVAGERRREQRKQQEQGKRSAGSKTKVTQTQLKDHCQAVLTELGSDATAIDQAVASFDALQYKRKLNSVIIDQAVAMLGSALTPDTAVAFIAAMLETAKVEQDDLRECLDGLVQQGDLNPLVCELMAKLVVQGCLDLPSLALCFTSTNLVEAWLNTFVHLDSLMGPIELQARVAQNGLDLLKVLPQSSRNIETMTPAIRQRGLAHLFPLLRLERELQELSIEAPAAVTQATTRLIEEYPPSVEYLDLMGQALLRKALQTGWPSSLSMLVPALKLLYPTPPRQVALIATMVEASHSHPDSHSTLAKAADVLYDSDVVEEEAWLTWEKLDDGADHTAWGKVQLASYLEWLATADEEEDSD
eukprot:m.144611 g.144611  ORF g.144611 m.144611 type:complete len:780 (+) comp16201_c0_seq8:41-2380(+)